MYLIKYSEIRGCGYICEYQSIKFRGSGSYEKTSAERSADVDAEANIRSLHPRGRGRGCGIILYR